MNLNKLKKIAIIPAFLIFVFFNSCQDEILNPEPTNKLPVQEALEDYSSVQSALTGCYDGLQDKSFYGRDLYVITELYSDNAKISANSTGRYNSFYSHSLLANDEILSDFWVICYDVINRANNVIFATPDIDDASEKEKNQVLGEAKAIRALVYFDLIQVFSHPYNSDMSSGIPNANGAGGHDGVPLVSDKNFKTNHSPAKSSVAEVCGFIIDDLKASDTLITIQQNDPYTFSSLAVEALLSKVYLYKSDYGNAILQSNKVIMSNNYSLVSNESYLDSWGQEFTSESIFSLSMTLTDNNNTNSLGYLFSKSGYNEIVPTSDISALFTNDTDIRKELYVAGSEVKKYPGRNNVTGIDNIPILRYSDILLVFSESLTRYALKTGKTNFYSDARTALDMVRYRANPNIKQSEAEGSELLEIIINERRKELAFEGDRFFTIKRSKLDINRNDCNLAECDLKYPNYRYSFPIPQNEINANDSIVQSYGY